MTNRLANHAKPGTLLRLVAALGVFLVFTLVVLAASPEAHEALCHHGKVSHASVDEAEGCVVTHFEQGHLSVALTLVFLVLASHGAATVLPCVTREAVAAGDLRLPRSCGPPSAV